MEKEPQTGNSTGAGEKMRLDNEGALTYCRFEKKIALRLDMAMELALHLERQFGTSNVPETRITSVYFDLPDHRFADAARTSPAKCLKIRTKEYDPDICSPDIPHCVIEIKRRRGQITKKRRFWLPRRELTTLFEGGPAPGGEQSRQAAAALSGLCDHRLLRPLVVVAYLRRIYRACDSMRITFDRCISFHLAQAEFLLDAHALTHGRLPAPFATESRAVVEIKHQGRALPGWANSLFGAARANGYSKFGTAVSLLQNVMKTGAG